MPTHVSILSLCAHLLLTHLLGIRVPTHSKLRMVPGPRILWNPSAPNGNPGKTQTPESTWERPWNRGD